MRGRDRRKSRRWRFPLALLLVVTALTACNETSGVTTISLAKRVDVARVRPRRSGSDQRENTLPLRVAIASVLSPTRTLEGYHDLLSYMGQRLGRPVQLFQRSTYAEINELVRIRDVDLAFVCAGALVDGEKSFGMEALVVPEVGGKTSYYSYLIVNRHSPATDLEHLRGKRFAFSDPLSNSGRLVPLYVLKTYGESPERFFGRHVFTYSHDNSIVAVADGLVDAAAVDSLVYDYLAARQPNVVAGTRVIERWGPYGIPPVAVHPDLDARDKRLLKEFLLSIHTDPRGAEILKELLIDRFVAVEPALFQSVRQMDAAVRRH